MPRFYLQLRDHTEETLDPEGANYLDMPALIRAVLAGARELIAADATEGVIDFRFRIDAEDENGKIVHTLPFLDAVRLIEASPA